jgi:hypothetical protein
MNGFPMDGASVGAGSQTLCLACLLAFVVIFGFVLVVVA